MTHRSALAAAALGAVLSLSGCGGGGKAADAAGTADPPGPAPARVAVAAARASVGALRISGGYIPRPASPEVAAAYLTIRNTGDEPDSIVTVSTNLTASVSAMTETERGGVGTMSPLGDPTIPAHGALRFRPGHAHLMLEQPSRPLHVGDQVRMTITFRHAGTVEFAVPVVGIAGPSRSPALSPGGTG